jgi:hypothetical protein
MCSFSIVLRQESRAFKTHLSITLPAFEVNTPATDRYHHTTQMRDQYHDTKHRFLLSDRLTNLQTSVPTFLMGRGGELHGS